MRIATAAQMKQIEQNAANSGITYAQMMENAGRAAAEYVVEQLGTEKKRAFVFCGPGNNGGDGFVAARCLMESGFAVKIVLVDGEPKGEDARGHLEMARQTGIEAIDLAAESEKVQALMQSVHIVVDAIFGTGFHGELKGRARMAAWLINGTSAPVFALDLPTGVDADTGGADNDAVRATYTIAFDSLKAAHFIAPGMELCGELVVTDIGIPAECRADVPQSIARITDKMVFSAIPQRPEESHKGMFGKLLNISSSLEYIGAGRLSTLGAQRVGTGLVTLAAPRALIGTHAAALTEAIFLPLEQSAEGTVSIAALEQLLPALEKASAVLVGCGLGNNNDTAVVTETVVRTAKCPVVVDADGINALGRNINVLDAVNAPVVLTPHLGEMARLLSTTVEEVQRRRVELVGGFAKQHQVIVVLKGPGTLVFSPDGGILINTTGGSGLAKAGSGDVLAGIIAGLLAQGIPAKEAAMCGVYLHGMAGDRCAQRLSSTAMLPTDLLTDLCSIFLKHGR